MMRSLYLAEEELVSKLLSLAGLTISLNKIVVTEMKDGRMGSLAIGINYSGRTFGKQAAEYSFKDVDGVEVSATLNLDSDGELYELDLFKADFSPTQSRGES